MIHVTKASLHSIKQGRHKVDINHVSNLVQIPRSQEHLQHVTSGVILCNTSDIIYS